MCSSDLGGGSGSSGTSGSGVGSGVGSGGVAPLAKPESWGFGAIPYGLTAEQAMGLAQPADHTGQQQDQGPVDMNPSSDNNARSPNASDPYGFNAMFGTTDYSYASGGSVDTPFDVVDYYTNLGSYSDGGQLLQGPGDGLSDDIPATIDGNQPAQLADGEFVVPADVVSALGGGSTDAGAQRLYEMIDRIRMAAHGTSDQIRPVNLRRVLPT